MPGDGAPGTVDAVRRLLLVIVGLVTLAGCSPPADDRVKWAGEATSPDVVAARADAADEAFIIAGQVPVKVATFATEDSCGAGERDEWNDTQYQYSCTHQTIFYAPVDGLLLPVLAKTDESLRAHWPELLTDSYPYSNVQYYFAHGGKSTDGLQLSRPRLSYSDATLDIGVSWRDPAFPDLDQIDTSPRVLTSGAYETTSPAVDLPKLIATHDNVLAIFVRQTYFTVPWPSPK
jgi:hypothetical protein